MKKLHRSLNRFAARWNQNQRMMNQRMMNERVLSFTQNLFNTKNPVMANVDVNESNVKMAKKRFQSAVAGAVKGPAK